MSSQNGIEDNQTVVAGAHRPTGSFPGERWFASSDGPSNSNGFVENLNNPSQISLAEAGPEAVTSKNMRLKESKTQTLEDDRAFTTAGYMT